MLTAYQESKKRREFRESVERSIRRAADLKAYLEGRREQTSPAKLYKPTHGGYCDGAGI